MNMPFRLPINAAPSAIQISHSRRLLLIGSCFTEHIGTRLAERKFNTLVNPFGIVYNPYSIANTLVKIQPGNQAFTETSLFENAGLWHSWEHHGHFSQPDKDETLAGINNACRQAADFFKKADFLLLTLGTAEVFALRASGQIVANNHKMPAAHFTQRRLSVSEIVENLLEVLRPLASMQIILTVSPVRHLRNGPVENQRSKATLLLAGEEICRHLDNAHYFPAYELLMDDLRDYRFYAPDMIHPSEVAVEYIWQVFSETFFSEKTRLLNERIDKIRTAAQHRPFHAQTPQHQAFVKAQLQAIAGLKQEMPDLDFSAEIARFTQDAVKLTGPQS